jgi:uncharacterized membrane protein YeaQ/YmgE (transglycosylase-associated protein family)
MTVFIAICFGLLLGVIARALIPGNGSGGWIMATLSGIGGAVVTTHLLRAIGWAIGWSDGGLTAVLVTAVILAILLVTVYRLSRPNPRPHSPRS